MVSLRFVNVCCCSRCNVLPGWCATSFRVRHISLLGGMTGCVHRANALRIRRAWLMLGDVILGSVVVETNIVTSSPCVPLVFLVERRTSHGVTDVERSQTPPRFLRTDSSIGAQLLAPRRDREHQEAHQGRTVRGDAAVVQWLRRMHRGVCARTSVSFPPGSSYRSYLMCLLGSTTTHQF